MTKTLRRQLTLFVEPKDAETIEQVRREFNPRQFELIKAHVTLCREHEIEHLEQVVSNLLSIAHAEIIIEFRKAVRFDNGKGLFLPATPDQAVFHKLRRQILSGLYDHPGKQEPHITLMHPRNSTCTDSIYQIIEKISLPTRLKFKKVSLIEQENSGPWKILQEFELKDKR